jgi:hypothetical protein
MTKILARFLCSVAFFSGTFVYADQLPKSAKALTTQEIKTLYTNHTVVWKPNNLAFFAPDGSVKGTFKDGTFFGTWAVIGNESCMMNKATNAKTKTSDGKIYTDCWQWFRDSKNKYWTLWSKHFDGSKVEKNGYYDDEIKKLKNGDLATAKISAMISR